MKYFWDRCRKEYIVNLREYNSTKQKVSSNPMIKLKDLVLAHDDCDIALLQWFGQSDSRSLSKTKQVRTNDKAANKQALPIGNNRRKGK